MKTSRILPLFALAFFFRASVAHADLTPPGGEGVQSCHNKKAGEACENYVIEGMTQHKETGTCVEEKLDHLHFKFKAHLRCVSASVPKPSASASAAAPSASAAAPLAPAASTPPAPSATPTPPPVASASTPAEAAKGGCSFAVEPDQGIASVFVAFALGILVRKRRNVR